MDEKEVLKKKIEKMEVPLLRLRKRYGELCDADNMKKRMSFVGKYFIYRDNCYRKGGTHWNVYLKIVGVTKCGYDVISFSLPVDDGFNGLLIERCVCCSMDIYKEISRSEFESGVKGIMQELQRCI